MPIINTMGSGQTIQVSHLPELTSSDYGKVVQYVGETDTGEPTFTVKNVETQDPVTVTLDIDTFKHFLVEEVAGGNEEILQQDFDLSFIYSNSAWYLYYYGQIQEDFELTTEELSTNLGITLDYGTGTVHENDLVNVYFAGYHQPEYTNGYFYQAGVIHHESEIYINGVQGDLSRIDVNKRKYERYVTEDLHEELEDAEILFTYNSEIPSWTVDNQEVDLSDYGISLEYNNVEVEAPAYIEYRSNESRYSDPDAVVSLSANVSTFESWLESQSFEPRPEELYHLELIYQAEHDNWRVSFANVIYFGDMTQQEIEQNLGVTFSYTSGRVSDGDMIIADYQTIHTEYQPGDPQEGDMIELSYIAANDEYKWLEKDVQGHKIDKFDVLPEPTAENEDLIVQYSGETEITESAFYVFDEQSEEAQVSVALDKEQFERSILNIHPDATKFYYTFDMDWDSGRQQWYVKGIKQYDGDDENVVEDYFYTNQLQQYGVYVTVDPDESTLYWAHVSFVYEPQYEGYHNGYFYKSIKEHNDESLRIDNFNNLQLDDENPYELDPAAYREYIESQGEELESHDTQFSYGPVSGGNEGWYDSWYGERDPQTGLPEEVDIESDYGVTLHYKEEEFNVNRCSSALSWHSTYQPRMYISKLDTDTLIRGLIDNRVISAEPTEPTSFYFQNYGSDSYRVNGVDVGPVYDLFSTFGVALDEVQRAPTFEYGDYFTIYFTPDVTADTQTSTYLLVDGVFQNADPQSNGGYVGTLDINTFEQELVPTPTEVTYYKWECTNDGDPSTSTWTMSEIYPNQVSYGTCDPADYGITLSYNAMRAPQTPFLTGDTFTVMYRPANKDIFRVSHEYWENNQGIQGVNIVDETTFKRNFYDNDGWLRENILTCVDDANGVLSDTRWRDSYWDTYSYQELETKFGVTLNQTRASAYVIGDYFELEYIPAAYNTTLLPEEGSSFMWSYSPEYDDRYWDQVDVQPGGVVDYSNLDNKPKINGNTIESENRATDLDLMDLSTNQTAEGRKIINELYRTTGSSLEALISSSNPVNLYWGDTTILPRDENTAFIFGEMSSYDVGTSNLYGQEEKSYPAFGIINREDGSLVNGKMYPLNPDPSRIASNWYYYGSTVDILGGFASNVAEWVDTQNNNKKYLFAITSPCILAKIDPDLLTPEDYDHAVIQSWIICNYSYYIYNSIQHNRIRVQGDNIYIFEEYGDGTFGGLYPTKFEIRGQYMYPLGYTNMWSAGGYYNTNSGYGTWGRLSRDKESGFDYQIMTVNNIDYCYMFATILESPFYDINGTQVDHTDGTIYKFPLTNTTSGDNLEYLGYQFDPEGSGKCQILNISKIDERYLLVASYYDAIGYTIFSLFDTTTDRVVDSTKAKVGGFFDDCQIYNSSEGVYIVSGLIDTYLFKLTIDTRTGDIREEDDSFIYSSAYESIRWTVTSYDPISTIYAWDNDIKAFDERTYTFKSPFIYSRKQVKGGGKEEFIWMGINSSLDRYATESYVDSIISTSGFISSDYLINNGYVTERWCNDYNISYNNLANMPFINGVQVYGNKSSQDYHIIDAYGINITTTQMFMNDKGIRYDTPFQVSTVIQGGGSEYSQFDICYVIPSKTENNIYYQAVNYIPTGTAEQCCAIFKYNARTNEREIVSAVLRDRKYIAGTYNREKDFIVLIVHTIVGTQAEYYLLDEVSSDTSRHDYYQSIKSNDSGRYITFGDAFIDKLEGLFIDNDSYTGNSGESALSKNALLHILNTSNHIVYTLNMFVLSSEYSPRWVVNRKTKSSSEQFLNLKNNIIKKSNYNDGQSLISEPWKGMKFESHTVSDLSPNSYNRMLLAKEYSTDGFAAITLANNWSTSYYTLTEVAGTDREVFSIPNTFVQEPAAKVYVDNVAVTNYEVEPDPDSGQNYWIVRFDSPVTVGATVKAQINGAGGGTFITFDGTNWSSNDFNGIVLPRRYNGSYFSYTFFIATDDSTNHYIAISNELGQDCIFTTSGDGETWEDLQSMGLPANYTILNIVYNQNTQELYAINANGVVYAASISDLTNWQEIANASGVKRGMIESACMWNGKIVMLDNFSYTDYEIYSSPVYVYAKQTCIWDIANDTWEVSGLLNTYNSSSSSISGRSGIIVSDGIRLYIFQKSDYYSTNNQIYPYNNYTFISTDGYDFRRVQERSSDGNQFYQDEYPNTSLTFYNTFATDGNGGLYQVSYNRVISNGLGDYYQNQDKFSCYYETYPVSYRYTGVCVSQDDFCLTAKYDVSNISLLELDSDTADYKSFGIVGPGYIHKQVDSQQYNSLTYYFTAVQQILKGNNNNAYLAVNYNSKLGATSTTYEPEVVSRGSHSTLVQSPLMPFIYMVDDNDAIMYTGTNSQTLVASAASMRNGYERLLTQALYIMYPTGETYLKYKGAPFKVMPTYTLNNVRVSGSTGRGSGYQAGETFKFRITSSGATYREAVIEITSVDADGGVTALNIRTGGIYFENPWCYSSSSITTGDYSGSGTGLVLVLYQNDVDHIVGPHNGGWYFGNLTVKPLDIITPDYNSENTWIKRTSEITDENLIELHGSFENDGGIESITAIESHPAEGESEDLSTFYFYCLIKSVGGTTKAYKSENISFFKSYANGIELHECSTDLTDATAGTQYTVSYLAQYAFVYSPDNFYITMPAFVNFKGKITDLYDTNFMELYTSHPTTGFVVPALENKRFKHTFTKPSDFKRYYYNYISTYQLGSGWEAGVHQVDAVFHTTDGDINTRVLFETDVNGQLKQVFNISTELGDAPLSDNHLTLINPDDPQAGDILLTFETVDLNNTSFIPSIEKYGVVKRGYKVKTAIDPTDSDNSESFATVDAIIQYVQSLLS